MKLSQGGHCDNRTFLQFRCCRQHIRILVVLPLAGMGSPMLLEHPGLFPCSRSSSHTLPIRQGRSGHRYFLFKEIFLFHHTKVLHFVGCTSLRGDYIIATCIYATYSKYRNILYCESFSHIILTCVRCKNAILVL